MHSMILNMYKEGRDIYPNINTGYFYSFLNVPIFILYVFLCYRNFL